MLNQLGPFGSFGIRNATISISATAAPELEMVVRGAPNLPTLTNETSDIGVS